MVNFGAMPLPRDILDFLQSLTSSEWTTTRTGSLVNLAVRVAFWPVAVGVELATLSSRIVWDEPEGYNPRATGLSRKAATRLRQGTVNTGRGVPTLIFGKRIQDCSRSSWMLGWEAILYFICLNLCAALGVSAVFAAFQKDIQWLMSSVAGSMHTLADGQRIPCAGVNVSDANFSLPYSPVTAFPALNEGSACPDTPLNVHMLFACSRLVYEDARVMKDVVLNRWHMQWQGYEAVKGKESSAQGYAIDSVWFMCGIERAVVVAFRGADPYLQMDRRSDIPVAMVHKSGVGRVMAAFLRTLEQPFSGTRNGDIAAHTIAGDLIRQLRKVAGQRQIYLTGHSLGAALAVLFGQLLCARQPELARQVAGVITFAGPRVGDAEFVDLISHRLPNKIFRFEHASDIVPRLPQGNGYLHGGLLRYITSFRWPGQLSRMIREEDAPSYCKSCYQNEERWAYPISLAKLLVGPFQESWPRVALRLTLLPLPGLSDHMPCDYETVFCSRLPPNLK